MAGKFADLKHNEQLGRWEAWYNGELISKGRSKDYIVLHINGGGSAKAKKLGIIGVKEGTNVVTAGGQVTTVQMANPVSIVKRFEFLEKFTNMVIEQEINSLIVTGEGGLGKTHTILDCLKKAKLEDIRQNPANLELDEDDEPYGDYIIFKGNSTAKGLYRALYENRNKFVIFDDCDSVLKDPVAQQLLKAALDSYDERIISWNAEMRQDDNLPRYFEFTGRIIFISNLPQHKLDQAIKSRSLRVDLSMTAPEKIERMQSILKNICPEHDMKIKEAALKFIDSKKDIATDLNFRTLIGVIKIAATGSKDWKAMAEYTMSA